MGVRVGAVLWVYMKSSVRVCMCMCVCVSLYVSVCMSVCVLCCAVMNVVIISNNYVLCLRLHAYLWI